MTAQKKRKRQTKKPRNTRADINVMLAVYSLGHFFVDMCCCAAMLAFTRDSGYFAISLLIYNFCAFALQMPIGAIADHFGRTGGIAVFGCTLIAVSMVATPAPLVLAALLGIGNACYHIGGGVFALRADGNCTRLGIFVSPGAIGLFLGRFAVEVLEMSGISIMIATALTMILSSVMILLTEPISETYESVAPFPHGLNVSYPMYDFMACVCFFAVVCMRSFGGVSFNFAWRGTADALLSGALLAAAATFGKAAGGIVSDRIGMRASSSVTLVLASILLLLSNSMIPAIIGVAAFNMTMPMTLRATADICRGREGFSFGLLTFALFIGYLPTLFGASLPFGIYGNAAVSLLSMAIMAAGLEFTSKRIKTV